MRTLTLRLAAAIIAFLIGLSAAHLWFWAESQNHSSESSVANLETMVEGGSIGLEQIDRSNSSIFGCKDPVMERIWANLDLEAIQKLKRKEIRVFNLHPDFTQYPSKKQYKSDLAEFERKGIDCSIFGSAGEPVDLNGDGVTELLVIGQIVSNHADGETYLFREIRGRWTPILFDKGSVESRVLDSRTLGHKDLEFKTNWSGGGRLITIYKFDGRVYRPARCYSQEHMLERKGEMIQLETPEREPTTCNPLDNLL